MASKDLAVQSYCFRGFKDNAEVAEKVKAIGLSRIELCGVHADFNDPDCFDEVIDTYRKAGVEIVSIGVQGFFNQQDKEVNFFEFAKRAGIGIISASFSAESDPECFRTAEKLADEFDINLAIHNHGGRHWLGSVEMLGAIFKRTSPRIGLMLDTAWALDSHEDPVQMIEKFGDRLYGLHLKDFVFDRSGKQEDVVVGTGNLDLDKTFAALFCSVGFDGEMILEYEGDVDNPVPALSKCVESIKAAAGACA